MASYYDDELAELVRIQARLRTIRDRVCEPKANSNPRYLGLSNAVAGITKAMTHMSAEVRD